ncbi:hypothetical protein [Nonomuraea sp. B5E05]|uniref:hypothetical protein n=1 Tax=Nonomuraea sp. B5E05 TaxID=3153569 RepID=UPI003261A18C
MSPIPTGRLFGTASGNGTDMAGDVGPGWEYYLDMLVASRDGSPTPDFHDYHPAMQAYYRGLSPETPNGA